jgi:glycosyltransferase involved in cell wall biosynthesis
MPNYPSISVCLPAYNDGGTISSVVILAITTLRQLASDFEVIVGDDYSSDYTAAILDELAKRYPELRVIHHPRNLGYGGNLRALFVSATKELIFYTDGDAQYDVRELTVLLPQMKPGVDIVNGYKIHRSDPLHRVVLGRIYHQAMRFLFGLKIRDVDCDFRLIRRSCFDAVTLESQDGTLPLEMVKKFTDAGFVFTEVPVHHFHRAYGHSQFFNWQRLIRVMREVVRLWFKLVWKKEQLKNTGDMAKAKRQRDHDAITATDSATPRSSLPQDE